MRSYFVAFLLLCVFSASAEWKLDILDGYENQILVLDKGVEATLVRKQDGLQSEKAVLYVHGYNDYFFQKQLGDSVQAHGYNFYALDLRKYGRSILPNQDQFFCKSLKEYFADIDTALAIIRKEGNEKVLLMAHSTGGLITPYYLHHRQDKVKVDGLILNSPFFGFSA